MLIETMSDSYELKAAVLAAKEAGINPEQEQDCQSLLLLFMMKKANCLLAEM